MKKDPTDSIIVLLFLAFTYLIVIAVVAGLGRSEILSWLEVTSLVRKISLISTALVGAIIGVHLVQRPSDS